MNTLLVGRALLALSLCLSLLLYAEPSSPSGGRVVVRNGHHRAIAALVLANRSQLPLDTVVGTFEGRSVTLAELKKWYDEDRLYAYNNAHDPDLVERLAKDFDPLKALQKSEGNPSGGIQFDKPAPSEALVSFKELKKYGSLFRRPNCQDTIARLTADLRRP